MTTTKSVVGTTSGMTMEKNTLPWPAPSIRAASIRAAGMFSHRGDVQDEGHAHIDRKQDQGEGPEGIPLAEPRIGPFPTSPRR